jgi:hypothetical protein
MANEILMGIKSYPFMHSGFTLIPGVLRAFEEKCPESGPFLNARLVVSEHLNCTSLSRKCLDPN